MSVEMPDASTRLGSPTTSAACRPYAATKSAGWNFQSGYTASMISNPSASHSTAASTAAGSPPTTASGAFSLKTISGSIFGAYMRAMRSAASPFNA